MNGPLPWEEPSQASRGHRWGTHGVPWFCRGPYFIPRPTNPDKATGHSQAKERDQLIKNCPKGPCGHSRGLPKRHYQREKATRKSPLTGGANRKSLLKNGANRKNLLTRGENCKSPLMRGVNGKSPCIMSWANCKSPRITRGANRKSQSSKLHQME